MPMALKAPQSGDGVPGGSAAGCLEVDLDRTGVVRELDVDRIGPSAFKKLLQLLTNNLDDGNQGRAFEQQNSFGVLSSTDFSTFLRAFKKRASLAQGTERIFKPSDAVVIEIV